MQSTKNLRLRAGDAAEALTSAQLAGLRAAVRLCRELGEARATFENERDDDTHRVTLRIDWLTAEEIVREVVDAIARNTERTDRHERLLVGLQVAKPGGVNRMVCNTAAARLRELYTGPYAMVIVTHEAI